jgi:hypothetical protein
VVASGPSVVVPGASVAGVAVLGVVARSTFVFELAAGVPVA